MIFIAKVDYRIYDYDDSMSNDLCQPWENFTNNHTIEASNEEEAEEKIKAFYKNKGDDYTVTSVNFFEHIE